jgi:Rrf2 family protein
MAPRLEFPGLSLVFVYCFSRLEAVKLSKRCEYALRALIDLGIAHALGRGFLKIRELAENEKIPEKFLEQILVQLKQAGYLESLRGRQGGYRLLRPAAKVVLGAIVRLVDGPLAPIPCVSQSAYAPCSCPDEMHCGLRIVMLDVRNAISGILDRYTLEDVVGVTLRKIRRDKATPPFAASRRR